MIISLNFTPAIFFGNQLIGEIYHNSSINILESLSILLNGILSSQMMQIQRTKNLKLCSVVFLYCFETHYFHLLLWIVVQFD